MKIAIQNYFSEFRYNLTLAYPVIIGLLGHTFVQLIDNIMVGQLGTAPLAAVSLGNSFVFVGMSLGIGFSTTITPLVAESDGAKNFAQGRKVFIHSFLQCVVLGFFLAFSVWMCRPLLFKMGQPAEVVQLAYPYLQWVAFSLIPLVIFQAFKQFCDGLSHTRPPMYATLLGNLVNIILNYFLIFGVWIFPKMGIEGAAIGTLIARLFMVIYIAFYVRIDQRFRSFTRQIVWQWPDFKLMKRILNLGFPSALQMFFEVIFFTAAIWLSGLLGKNEQAANQIALNLSSITFMFALGLGVTAMIRVGNQKGRGDFINLKRIAYSIFLLILILDLVFALFFMLTNQDLPWIYLDQNNLFEIADSEQVVFLAAQLLIVAAFFQLFDGMQAVVLGALRGLQDLNIPAWITFFSYGLFGFPIAYFLGLKTQLGVLGIWIGLLSGLIASAILLFLRFQNQIKTLIFNHHSHDIS